MLTYGPSNCLQFMTESVIFGITSLREGLNRLNYLIPPNSLGQLSGRDFDIAYANYIMCNDPVFCDFFQIIYNLYLGNNVYLVIDCEDWSENLVESLLKLIQQRYGYNSYRIESFEDFLYASNNYEFGFNPDYGIYNLDIDRERYTYLCENLRLQNGGKPYKEEE